jgi:hydrogenase expression/formation protein HypE
VGGSQPLHTGKLSTELLQQVVFPYTGTNRPDVLVRPGVGQDCSVVDLGDELAILSSDPITTTGHNLGYLAVHISANDIAATGADPVGLMLTLLLPAGTSTVNVKAIMKQVHEAATSLGMAVLGGHTEFTDTVRQPLAAVTALGKARKRHYVTASGGRPGDVLVLTKTAACEGTAILAADLKARLEPELGEALLRRARAFIEHVSVVPEAKIAIAYASAMHDVTESGVLGATFELAHASGLGLELWADKVPVADETAAICRVLDLNPLGLIGSGSLLIATTEPNELITALASASIKATAIGRLLPKEDGQWLQTGQQRQPLVVPERDELYKVL